MIYDMVNSASALCVSARTAIVSNLSDSFLTALKNSSFIIPRSLPLSHQEESNVLFFPFFFILYSNTEAAGIEKGTEELSQLQAAERINTSDS